MTLTELITFKDAIYLVIGLILGIFISVIMHDKTEKLYLHMLRIFGKATYGTYIKVTIYNPIYDDRDPISFDNSGVNNGLFTYEVNLPYRFIEQDKIDISMDELDQQIIETINNKYKTTYSTRYTKLNNMEYKQNLIFKISELDRKRYR